VTRAHKRRAEAGRPNWTRRPFGHNPDGSLHAAEAEAITAAARAIFFADRTVEAVFERLDHPRAAELHGLYAAHRVSQKTRDALELLERLKSLQPGSAEPAPGWRVANSPFWTGRDTSRSSSVTPL
jgi:hypothetical protein